MCAGKRAAGEAWDQAKALWQRLRGKERVATAAEAAAALPDNPALRDALRQEIARALAEDQALAAEVARLWEKVPAERRVVAAGDRSVAIGGDVSGSVIVTGDHNQVSR